MLSSGQSSISPFTLRHLTKFAEISRSTVAPEPRITPRLYAMIPVTIETSDWAEKKRGADKIFNLEIDILLGTQSTQLR